MLTSGEGTRAPLDAFSSSIPFTESITVGLKDPNKYRHTQQSSFSEW